MESEFRNTQSSSSFSSEDGSPERSDLFQSSFLARRNLQFLYKLPRDCQLHIANLAEDVTWYDLMGLFKRYGRLIKVWLATRNTGFGFVYFENVADARDAKDALNNLIFHGKAIKVTVAKRLCFWCGRRGHIHKHCIDGIREAQAAAAAAAGGSISRLSFTNSSDRSNSYKSKSTSNNSSSNSSPDRSDSSKSRSSSLRSCSPRSHGSKSRSSTKSRSAAKKSHDLNAMSVHSTPQNRSRPQSRISVGQHVQAELAHGASRSYEHPGQITFAANCRRSRQTSGLSLTHDMLQRAFENGLNDGRRHAMLQKAFNDGLKDGRRHSMLQQAFDKGLSAGQSMQCLLRNFEVCDQRPNCCCSCTRSCQRSTCCSSRHNTTYSAQEPFIPNYGTSFSKTHRKMHSKPKQKKGMQHESSEEKELDSAKLCQGTLKKRLSSH